MIIGYYPGAGGNRYYQYIHDRDYQTPGVAYDYNTDHEAIRSRGLYLETDNIPKIKSKDILTHCVNYNRITQALGSNDVVIIKSDLMKSLRREWSIKGKFKPMFQPLEQNYEHFVLGLYLAIRDESWPTINNLTDFYMLDKQIIVEVEKQVQENIKYINTNSVYNFVEAAYTSIVWHNNIYSKYPLQAGSAHLVDIDLDDTDFASTMRDELELHKNNHLFNFAWDVYSTHGNSAPILTLYKEAFE